MKLYSILALIVIMGFTAGCKGGGKTQQAAAVPAPAPVLPQPLDTDKDGIADATDPDDDNDGVADAQDRFPLDAKEVRDSDLDNQGDSADLDDDNDALADAFDVFPLDPKEQKDNDSDGIGDNTDTDDDNDGVLDTNDRFPLSSLESADSDGDGIGDKTDPDDDNDAIADAQDALPLNAKESADADKDGLGDTDDLDDDNDGVADLRDVFPLDIKETKDSDGDGIGDSADADDDNDGTPDLADAFSADAKEQKDTDADGIGDNADTDDDNDGVADTDDKFPLNAAESKDSDADGTGDNADADDDNDGAPDLADAFAFNAKEQKDTDADGVGDNQDSDDDNDGIADKKDLMPLDAKESADFDGDGSGDNADLDDDNDAIADTEDATLALTLATAHAIYSQAIVKIDRVGKIAYILNPADNSLAAINLVDGAILKTIKFNESARLISLNPDGSKLFVATSIVASSQFSSSETGKVYGYSLPEFNKTFEFELGGAPVTLEANSPDSLFVSNSNYYGTYQYDARTGARSPYSFNEGGKILVNDPYNGFLYAARIENFSSVLSKYNRNNNNFQALQRAENVLNPADEQLWLNPVGTRLISSTGRIIQTASLIASSQIEIGSNKITAIDFDVLSNLALISLSNGSLALANTATFELIQIIPKTSAPLLGVTVIDGRLVMLSKTENNTLKLIYERFTCPDCTLNTPPKAAITADNASPLNGQTVQFDAAQSSDAEQNTVQNILLYRWDFDGDGRWDTEFSASPKASFSYAIAANYVASVQVKDAQGAMATAEYSLAVKQTKILPITNPIASDTLDFPVATGVFDGKDTVYYLDRNLNRVYLLDLTTGQATRYIQLDFTAKELVKSADLSKIYAVQTTSDNQNNTVISVIDTLDQAIVDSVYVRARLVSLIDASESQFLAYSEGFNSINSAGLPFLDFSRVLILIDKKTGSAKKINNNHNGVGFSNVFAGDAGNLIGNYSYELNRIAVQGGDLVSTGLVAKSAGQFSQGTPVYVSQDQHLVVAYNEAIPLNNPPDRVALAAPLAKAVSDPARNLAFIVTTAGAVEVFNTMTAQRIQTITLSKPIQDVIIKGDKLYLVLAVNSTQSIVSEYPHPCLTCKAAQGLAISLVAQPTTVQAGQRISVTAASAVDDIITSWLFRWDLNGDGVWDGPFAPQNTVQTTYSIPGIKFISAQAKNANGDLGSASLSLDLNPGSRVAETALNPVITDRVNGQTIVAAAARSGLFLITDQQTRTLYFYDVLLGQVTKELGLEFIPEIIKVSPDDSTAYVQVVERNQRVNVNSNYEKRYILRVDIANYAITHAYPLAEAGSLLTQALNADRILIQNNGAMLLLDSKSGTTLSSLQGQCSFGNCAVIGSRIFLDVSTLVSFANDTLTVQHVPRVGTIYSSNGTWALPGNQFVVDSSGQKLDVNTLKLVGRSPFGYSLNQFVISQEHKLGFVMSYSEVSIINTDTLQLIKTIRTNTNESRSAFFADGFLYTFGSIPGVVKLQEVCPECLNNAPPVAKLLIPVAPVDTVSAITLDASGSTDPERAPLNYRWDFNSDGIWDTEFSYSGIITKKIVVPGTVTVKVQVKDNGGSIDETSINLEVAQGVDAGIVYRSVRPFIFTEAPSDQVVDEARGYLYYTVPDRKRLYLMNLTSGLVDKYFTFEQSPQVMALSQDKRYLYVAPIGYSVDNESGRQATSLVISVIDLTTQSIVKTFTIKPGLNSMAALANGLLAVTSGNDSATALTIYEVATGKVVLSQPLLYTSRLINDVNDNSFFVLSYSQGVLTKFQFDPIGLTLSSQAVSDSTDYSADKGWLSPDKKYLILSNGSVLNASDLTLYTKIPSSARINSLVFSNAETAVWSDNYSNSTVRIFRPALALESPGPARNYLALFALGGQVYGIGREGNGDSVAEKVLGL